MNQLRVIEVNIYIRLYYAYYIFYSLIKIFCAINGQQDTNYSENIMGSADLKFTILILFIIWQLVCKQKMTHLVLFIVFKI